MILIVSKPISYSQKKISYLLAPFSVSYEYNFKITN